MSEATARHERSHRSAGEATGGRFSAPGLGAVSLRPAPAREAYPSVIDAVGR